MSRIIHTHSGKKSLGCFVTGGDPNLSLCEEYILEAIRGGADFIIIGIPFSDPVAEGPINQEANLHALSAGATTDAVLRLAASVREKTETPLILQSYVNPVFQYGFDLFFARCKEAGVDGIVLPDIPYEQKGDVQPAADQYGIDVISMIAPACKERMCKIAADAKGFLYVVPSMHAANDCAGIQTDLACILQHTREASSLPAFVGIDTCSPNEAVQIASAADEIILNGTAASLVTKHGDGVPQEIYAHVLSIKESLCKA